MLTFFKPKPLLVLEINVGFASLLVVSKTDSDKKTLYSQVIDNLSWPINPEQLRAPLIRIVNKYRCNEIVIRISSDYVQQHELPLPPNLNPAELAESVHLELERFYSNASDYYFDFTILNTSTVLVVTLVKNSIANLLSTLQNLHLKLRLLTSHEEINLLPWRTLQAEQSKKLFLSLVMLSSLIIVLASTSYHIYINHEAKQEQKQLQALQLVNTANEQKQLVITQTLKNNQEIIRQTTELQSLNARRYFLLQALTLFANKLPSGMYLTALKQEEGVLHIEGHAENHTLITQLVSDLNATPAFKLAQLQFVKEIPNSTQLTFAIQVPETSPAVLPDHDE